MKNFDAEVNAYLEEVFGEKCHVDVKGPHDELWLFDSKVYDNRFTKAISINRLDVKPNAYDACTFKTGESITNTELLFGIDEVKEWIDANKDFLLA